MILFVEDDGKWKVVNLTNINDFLIAMTSFLKSDKSTRGVGRAISAPQPRPRLSQVSGVTRVLANYKRVKKNQKLFETRQPLCDPAYWSTAPSYEAPGIISKVISQVLVASQSQPLQELWKALLIFWQCWTWNSLPRFPSWHDRPPGRSQMDPIPLSDHPLPGRDTGPGVINCLRLHLAPQLLVSLSASIQMIASQEARARQLSLARNKDSDGKINCFSLS